MTGDGTYDYEYCNAVGKGGYIAAMYEPNLYGYAGGSPVLLADYEGLAPKNPGKWKKCNDVEEKICHQQCARVGKVLVSCAVFVQERYCLNNGKLDTHDWRSPVPSCNCDDPNDPDPLPLTCPEKYKVKQDDALKAVGVGVGAGLSGYLIYRGLRMIPSLAIPALWPTIPLNLASPI